jgi:hypothetical protein
VLLNTTLQYASYALLVINALYYATSLIAGNLACIPHEKIWNPLLPGKCINRKALDTANAGINILSTIFILFLPQRVIWSLGITRRMKVNVSMVFAIGLLYVNTSYTSTFEPYKWLTVHSLVELSHQQLLGLPLPFSICAQMTQPFTYLVWRFHALLNRRVH